MVSGCSAVGSARGLGPWGREFESLHPDQLINHPISFCYQKEIQGPLAQLVRAVGS